MCNGNIHDSKQFALYVWGGFGVVLPGEGWDLVEPGQPDRCGKHVPRHARQLSIFLLIAPGFNNNAEFFIHGVIP